VDTVEINVDVEEEDNKVVLAFCVITEDGDTTI
jgi:hypothetical protein